VLLPEAVVENAPLYSILSKGIHDLSENECNAHFPVVLAGIQSVLEERLAERARREKAENAKKAVAVLKQRLDRESP
jgi:hypothetical protein